MAASSTFSQAANLFSSDHIWAIALRLYRAIMVHLEMCILGGGG